MLRSTSLALALCLSLATPVIAGATVSLSGSRSSMVRQNQVAKQNDYTFLRTPTQVERFVEEGYLVPVEANESLEVARGVSYPYARPELRTFLERLAAQYREGCGERLVVTSLTRPTSAQPGNSHPLSVHPAGMAVDLRVSQQTSCRQWLESALLSLERQEVLDVTRERHPPHYHVAVFPGSYMEHVARLEARDSARNAEAVLAAPIMASAMMAPTAPARAAQTAGAAESPQMASLGPAAVLVLLVVSIVASVRRRREARG